MPGPSCSDFNIFVLYSYVAVASVLLDGKDHSFHFIFLVYGFLTW